MKVTILGTSGGIPIPGRAQSGILVQTEDVNILLDCGMAVPLRLAEAGLRPEDIDLICLTHSHLDHIQDIPSLTKGSLLSSGRAEYDVICPLKTKKRVKKLLRSVGEYEDTDLSFYPLNKGEGFEYGLTEDVIENESDLHVKTFETDHIEESQGYIIQEGNTRMAYTGDTSSSENIARAVEGVDLLVTELSLPDLEDGEKKGVKPKDSDREAVEHMRPENLVSLLQGMDEKVERCVLIHFYPDVEKMIEEVAESIEKRVDISIEAASDLQCFRLK